MKKKFTYNQAIESIFAISSANNSLGVKYNLNSIRTFLGILKNPQNNYKTIHIAGTSGKGSTVTIISHLLVSHGFKVGLTLSPHILDIRERLMINNNYISESKFAQYYSEIYPELLRFNDQNGHPLSFFETMVALAYHSFDREDVDYAVIETGLGGTLDATNTISRADKICVISKIGLDHTQILGETIQEIARHKAGIIHNSNKCITCKQDNKALQIIENRCKTQKCELTISQPYKDTPDKLSLKGQYQLQNTGLAATTFKIVAKRDKFTIDTKKITSALSHITIPARFNILTNKKNVVILDGAHNVQKMQAFTDSLVKLYPYKKYIFILAFKMGKDWKGMVDLIRPLANSVYATSFQLDFEKSSLKCVAPKTIQNYCNKIGIVPSKTILQKDIPAVIDKLNTVIVLTGSLYFISNVLTELPYLRNMYNASIKK